MTTKGTFTLVLNNGKQEQLLLASDLLKNRLSEIRENKINAKVQNMTVELNEVNGALSALQDSIDSIRVKAGYTPADLFSINDLIIPTELSPERERFLYQKLASSKSSQDWTNSLKRKRELMTNRDKLQKKIERQRTAIDDSVMPSLTDIEQTHLNLLTKRFKPFVATGFEYTPYEAYGNSLSNAFGNEIKFKITNVGEYIHDQVLHLRLEGLTAGSVDDKVRYCNFLGHRIIEYIKFNVNGTDLDQYTGERYNTYYNFELPPNKKNGWLEIGRAHV